MDYLDIENIFDERIKAVSFDDPDKAEISKIIDDRLGRFREIVVKDLFQDFQSLATAAAKKPEVRFKPVRRRQISFSGKVDKVIARVCAETGYTMADLKGPGRKAHLAAARAKAMREVHALGLMSSTAIGKIFDRDHSTVLHAVGRCGVKIDFILKNPYAKPRDFEKAEFA